MSVRNRVVGFLVKYKWALIVATVVYVLLMVVLMAFSSGPQNEPFRYQIH